MMAFDFSSLELTADQKSKIDTMSDPAQARSHSAAATARSRKEATS